MILAPSSGEWTYAAAAADDAPKLLELCPVSN